MRSIAPHQIVHFGDIPPCTTDGCTCRHGCIAAGVPDGDEPPRVCAAPATHRLVLAWNALGVEPDSGVVVPLCDVHRLRVNSIHRVQDDE